MENAPQTGHVRGRHYRYYDLLLAGFVAVLLCSNLIGPAKVGEIALPFAVPLIGASLVFGAGNLFFPISYIFGDVLTEVYGYARARKAIWAGFMAMLFASLMAWVVIHLPANPREPFNASRHQRPIATSFRAFRAFDGDGPRGPIESTAGVAAVQGASSTRRSERAAAPRTAAPSPNADGRTAKEPERAAIDLRHLDDVDRVVVHRHELPRAHELGRRLQRIAAVGQDRLVGGDVAGQLVEYLFDGGRVGRDDLGKPARFGDDLVRGGQRQRGR